MYKNVKKTFEILRSEITLLMDLYTSMTSSILVCFMLHSYFHIVSTEMIYALQRPRTNH